MNSTRTDPELISGLADTQGLRRVGGPTLRAPDVALGRDRLEDLAASVCAPDRRTDDWGSKWNGGSRAVGPTHPQYAAFCLSSASAKLSARRCNHRLGGRRPLHRRHHQKFLSHGAQSSGAQLRHRFFRSVWRRSGRRHASGLAMRRWGHVLMTQMHLESPAPDRDVLRSMQFAWRPEYGRIRAGEAVGAGAFATRESCDR